MTESYLTLNKKKKTQLYNHQSSYIKTINSNNKADFGILPPEYDIFSKINKSFFDNCNDDQKTLINELINQIYKVLILIYREVGIIRPLPKMEVTVDSDGAIIVNWAYSFYRVYFDIESNINDSFYGFVIKKNDNTLETKTGELNNKNCKTIVTQLVIFIVQSL